MTGAIFLDRDGTLNRDTGYVHSREQWEWLPGSVTALALLRASGWPVIIVSNQSGIARGFYTEDDLYKLEVQITSELAKKSAAPLAWYHCPHLPELTGPCSCRKPEPGMLFTAAQDHGLDLSSSWMVGDKMSDVQAGLRAGCRPILLGSVSATCQDYQMKVRTAPDLLAAVTIILNA